jgi:hypothetical protein
MRMTFSLLFVVFSFTALCVRAETLLIEAEQFDELGGWVNDCQFMDQMGSPFLLAHGLGTPVKDATTKVRVEKAGEYGVWVRTRDWVATWNAPGAPGRFQLVVDGTPLETTFGTEGAKWHWQKGGTITVDRDGAGVTLALNDLTGFEGRCDAILLSTDANFRPPNEGESLAKLRRELLGLSERPIEGGEFDVVVTGGGIAGTCAAISAARLGLSVALVQDRPVLAGNNSSEVRVWLQGARNKEPYPRVGDIVRELEQPRRAHYGPQNTADLYEDEKKTGLVKAEENIALLLNHRANAVEMKDSRIAAVIAQNTTSGQRLRLVGRWFVDSTGDGCVGYLAGADCDITLEGHMGRCNLWNVIETDQPRTFPRCPWALDLTDKPFPGRNRKFEDQKIDHRGTEALGGWYWESGFFHDPFEKSEYIRDWNFRAMYGAWDALKNVDKRYPNHRLNWAAHISGKRESRRLLGDVILSKEDVLTGKEYDDGCVPTGWSIDLHLPDPRYEKGFEGDAFIAKANYTRYKPPYWVPYRCLYSRNVPNLLMAGRDISVTHEALGTVRVMRTGGCMGEIVGMAASLCKKHDCDPRGVYEKHLAELKELMLEGVGKAPPIDVAITPPEWIAKAGRNVAPEAAVSVSGSLNVDANQPAKLVDGKIDLRDNNGRWLSSDDADTWIELTWKQPRVISAIRVVSGFNQGGGHVTAPIGGLGLQYETPDGWKSVTNAAHGNNTLIDFGCQFDEITASKIRLSLRPGKDNIARIWEFEVYSKADK